MVVLSQRGTPKEFFLVDEKQDVFHLDKAIPFFPNTFSVLKDNRPPDYWFHPHYPIIQNHVSRVCIDLKPFQAELLQTGSAFYVCYLYCPKAFQELPPSEDDDFW